MEVNFSDTKPTGETQMEWLGKDRVRVKREALQAALEQCRRALESLNTTGFIDDDEKDSGAEVESTGSYEDRCLEGSPSTRDDRDDDEDLTPNQLQKVLSKTFSVKKKKGKLQKAWDGSKVIYNVASWGATAIGIYQNPVIISAATKAFWTSCHVISKLL